MAHEARSIRTGDLLQKNGLVKATGRRYEASKIRLSKATVYGPERRSIVQAAGRESQVKLL